MNDWMFALLTMAISQSTFAAKQTYTLERSSRSTQSCFDFIFGLSGSTQSYIKTVKIIGNQDGIAIGFDTKEIGDQSDLKTKFKVIAPATYLVFKGKSHEAEFSTGAAGYVKWNVSITHKIKKQRTLTSVSREAFCAGSATTSSCTLIQQ